MRVKKGYCWKILSEDGLIKEYEYGPYYSRETLNPSGGFDTEEEALEGLNKHSKIPYNLILVTMYSQVWE